LSVKVGVTSIKAYGCGYVTIDVQLLVSSLDADGEDHKDWGEPPSFAAANNMLKIIRSSAFSSHVKYGEKAC
jgi:hypothetical protein